MKVYKYRDLSQLAEKPYERLRQILELNVFWCAAPQKLNDPEEFFWSCDYTPTDFTIPLVSKLLVIARNRTVDEASAIAQRAVLSGRLEALAAPIFQEIIKQCRSEFGLVCFGTSAENSVLWERYGGAGVGACIEIEVPSNRLGKDLHSVRYPTEKSIHIDELLHSFLDPSRVWQVYEVALLSKPPCWSLEAEIRFVAKKQDVSVKIDDSYISALVLGASLSEDAKVRIRRLVDVLPYYLPVRDVKL